MTDKKKSAPKPEATLFNPWAMMPQFPWTEFEPQKAMDGLMNAFRMPQFPATLGIGMEADDAMSAMTLQFRTMLQVNELAWKALAAYHGEIHRFIDHRMRQEIALQRALSACKTPGDALEAFATFMQNAAKEYAEEMQTLGTVGSDLKPETGPETDTNSDRKTLAAE